MFGLNLYPSRQITHISPVSSPKSSICWRIVPLAVTWPLSFVCMPSAPNCLSRIAIAKRFFSLRVCWRASSISSATRLLVHNASNKFSAKEPTCSFDDTCSSLWIMLIVTCETANWKGIKRTTHIASIEKFYRLLIKELGNRIYCPALPESARDQ